MVPTTAPRDDAGTRGRWQVDQRALQQGLAPAVSAQLRAYAAREEELWDAAEALAARQPIVGSLDAGACAQIHTLVSHFRQQAELLVVIGTGGASLGAQALCAFAPRPARVLFLENCDTQSAHDILAQCDPARTAWAIISKSGQTLETLSASLALIAHYDRAGVSLAERVAVVTSPGDRPLRALALAYGWRVLDHPPTLGGRFSVFSIVGMLPASFAGFDIAALAAAARTAWDAGLGQRDGLLFTAAACFAASLSAQPLHVVMGYGDRLRPYTQWYKQLWAESLAKGGQGPTPVTSVGAVDQHSQLQLYLDGARDKLYTLILPDGQGMTIPLAKVAIPQLDALSRHSMQDIMHASAEATCDTLRTKGLPIRILKAEFCVESLVELMARTTLETLLVAAMLGIDPYSQPAVEEGKERACHALGITL